MVSKRLKRPSFWEGYVWGGWVDQSWKWCVPSSFPIRGRLIQASTCVANCKQTQIRRSQLGFLWNLVDGPLHKLYISYGNNPSCLTWVAKMFEVDKFQKIDVGCKMFEVDKFQKTSPFICNPRHPNTSWEGMLTPKTYQNTLSGGIWMYRYIIHIYIYIFTYLRYI